MTNSDNSTDPGERAYVLGTGDDELTRLGFQHEVWAAPTAAAWERAGFAPGDTILDVGCGPGYATLELATLVGRAGGVLALDASQRFIEHLQSESRRRGLNNIEARVQDLEALTLPADSIDGAFARWVLCFLSDPRAVVEAVAGALRPGGAFAVLDYCHYSHLAVLPRSEIFEHVVRAIDRSFRGHGGNPDIGGELPGLMRAAGLEVRTLEPLVRLGRPGTALWDWPGTFFANYLPDLVEMGEITADERAEFEREWAARSRDPDSYFLSPPMVEIIAVKS
jgi:SAM-dependent methyltransferase